MGTSAKRLEERPNDDSESHESKKRRMIAEISLQNRLVLDLTTKEFVDKMKNNKRPIMKIIRKEKPVLIIGDESFDEEACKFLAEAYREQNEQGRYFMHVRRKGGDQWREEWWTNLQGKTSASAVNTSRFRVLSNCVGIIRSINDNSKMQQSRVKFAKKRKDDIEVDLVTDRVPQESFNREGILKDFVAQHVKGW